MGNNELKIFENSEFGSVRVVMKNEEPWFVVSDVCKYFGVSNRNRVMQSVDPEDKGGTQMDTPGGKQDVAVVNESGLYSVLFALQPSKARGVTDDYIEERQKKLRKFKRWVTSEVLPSIRKHGGYLYGQEQMTDEEMLCASLLFAQKKIEDRDRKIASLEKEKALLTKEVLTWRDEPLLNALVRKYAHEACGGNFACGWKSLFKELLYQHGINLESRKAQFKLQNPDKGAGATYKFLKQSEMPLAFSSITALCEKRGVDISALLEKKAG